MVNFNSTQEITIWNDDGSKAVTVDELSASALGLNTGPLGYFTVADPAMSEGEVWPLRHSASGRLMVETYPASTASGIAQRVLVVDRDGDEAAVTPAGRLQVTSEPPAPPLGLNAIKVTEFDDVLVSHDNVWTIPNGSTLTLQRLSGGAEETNAGNTIELWYDPDGDGGANMVIIDVIFSSATSDQHDLNDTFVGDGTKAIRLRRRRLSGGAVEIFGRWEGYY